ncbi:hypothetical protein BG004_002774, partial [Podila humilis]
AGPVNDNWVRRSVDQKDKISPTQIRAVASICNVLRPFVPKRRPKPNDDKATDKPIQNIALSLHAMPIDATALYEIFCSAKGPHFEVYSGGDTEVSSVPKARQTPMAMWEAFFKMEVVHQMCKEHQMIFEKRVMFIDNCTIQVLGKQIPHGPDRCGHPATSAYEAARKKRAPHKQPEWLSEMLQQGWTQEGLVQRAELADAHLEAIEKKLAQLKRQWSSLDKERAELALEHRQLQRVRMALGEKLGKASQEHEKYRELQAARVVIRKITPHMLNLEMEVTSLKQESYRYHKASREFGKQSVKSKDKGKAKMADLPAKKFRTSPSWDHVYSEDSPAHIDPSQLLQGIDEEHRVVFSGTDYGLKKMSVSVPVSIEKFRALENRYWFLQDHPDTQDTKSQEQDDISLDEMKLPKTSQITAPHINDVSHMCKRLKNRENRLRKNKQVKDALSELSKNGMSSASTVEQVTAAQATARNVREHLRDFELSKAISFRYWVL